MADSNIREKPSPAATSAGEPSSLSLPTRPEAAAVHDNVSAGAAAGATAGLPVTGDDSPASRTFKQRMAGSEEHWMWKLGLRVLICVIDVIGIACIASVLSSPNQTSSFGYGYGYDYFVDRLILPFALIPLAVSFIWCLITILVLLLRRPPRPVHPGIAVGFDLILWLAFIVTLIFTAYAVFSVGTFGSNPDDVEDPSAYGYGSGYGGHYTRASNGSYIYEITSVNTRYYRNTATETATVSTSTSVSTTLAARAEQTQAAAPNVGAAVTTPTPTPALAARATSSSSSYNPFSTSSSEDDYYYYTYTRRTTTSRTTRTTRTTTSSVPTATPTRNCQPEFSTCADQDKYVNTVMHDRTHRYGLDIAAAVTQGLAMVLHFALFVWACVDTNRRNHAHRIANDTANVLQDLRQKGYVMVPADAYLGGGPHANPGVLASVHETGVAAPSSSRAAENQTAYPGASRYA